ncbi:MAG TPA: hypothetical protein DEA65_05630 [Candidatus Marinimicrobia bacterium]|jgi:hypothetical protein|nr:hypothetical protein [Candidatus Neomarinimicrobiota bacterium]MDP7095603.1 hypothetical protein [Candidatus Neomarinimicrobiota bacterium]MDP7165204.1 hypothetical protein [Candidatus Neomarinimicrobiota bacterium]MDP7512299.1 hypothetical protein [Candidatus Neomarinimicrobiota bacterium]HBR87295.1 hypothetical protein [Candidatus Neomarinimicrobiota bacterium]|tara:strand:+ start:96 stop:557 length:462 start_codon:yes stop_codon:yes gene_type:complete
MNNLWDDLKKNMKDWSSIAVEKAEEVSKIAVAKTEELTKISKIKIEIHQLQRDLAKTYENLGRLVAYHAKEENMVNFTGNKEFYNSLQKIEDIQDKITEKEAEIQKVKDEFGLQESDITAAEQNVEAESIKEETVEEDEATQGEVPDPDNPPS